MYYVVEMWSGVCITGQARHVVCYNISVYSQFQSIRPPVLCFCLFHHDMMVTRDVHGCAMLDSGLVVVAGGDGKSSVEILKPGSNSWTQGTLQYYK